MKTKITLAVSLLINVALAVLMIRGRGHQRADIVLTESTASVTSTTDVSGVARVVEPRSHNSTASHEPERVASPDPISNIWKQVAVSDYQQFAENLRALGVPEETVRDIVMMDLIKTLGEDMMTLSRRAEKPFW
jgi:hypothetical protein